MNWLHYLLEANIYLGVFYVAYCLFLNKETHYLLNRLYLVLSSIVSFILPVLQLGILLPPLPEPSTASYSVAEQVTNVPAPIAVPVQVTAPAFTLQDGLWYAYVAGIIVCTVLLIIKLFSLFNLIRTNKVTVRDNYKVVYLKDTNTAFSFFNYLFIGTAANNEHTILRHELVHIRQKHSADIIFLEILKIINWFNPLVYLLQHSLKTQHEYIADEQTVTEEADATSYSSFLVNNAYGLSGPAITHSFYNLNLLKNRIIMLHQQRSGSLARLKYLVAVPIGAALLCVSTLGFSKTYGWIDLAPKAPIKLNVQTPPQQKAPVTKKTTKLLPPPIPAGFKPQKTYVNTKGYKIEEGLYSRSGITMYIVIISDPSGKKIKYKNNVYNKFIIYKGMIDEEKTALAIYGYKFPDVKVSGMVIKPKQDQVKFPPPIVKPDTKGYKQLTHYIDPNNYHGTAELSQIATNFKDANYIMTYKDAKTNDSNQLQISLETSPKLGKHRGASATFDLDLLRKTNYIIAVGFDNTKQTLYVHSIPRTDQVKFPPPVAELKVADKRVYNSKTRKWTTLPTPNPKIDQVKFPPPIVRPDTFNKHTFTKPNPFTVEFFKFLGDHVKYPVDAREKGTMGYVVVEIKIDDYMITNSRILNGIGHGCDEEVLRVLNTYKNKTKVKSGTYKVSVAFMLGDPDNPIANPPMPKIAGETSGHVVIVGYGTKK
jgi:hypothetical protein